MKNKYYSARCTYHKCLYTPIDVTKEYNESKTEHFYYVCPKCNTRHTIFKYSFVNKFSWFKIKNSDRLDRWSIGHFGLGMIAGMLAVVNPYIGFAAFNLILLWEFIEYWLSQKVDAEKYWLDSAGISLTDMCLDCLGFAVVLIFSGVFKWRLL